MDIFESDKIGMNQERFRSFRKRHSSGAYFAVSEYAAAITELWIPDAKGELKDVVLGFSDHTGYIESSSCHGSVVGRVANRTRGASFTLNGKSWTLPRNDGENNLHGGPGSYQNVYWNGVVLSEKKASEYLDTTGIDHDFHVEGEAVLFTHESPELTDGLPGNLTTEVLYAWSEDATLIIVYRGTSDADTLFAPTNHSYFNLAGHDGGPVGDHWLKLESTRMTNKGEDNVPDGTFCETAGSVFDFSRGKNLSETMTIKHPQLISSRGLDQNYCLTGSGNQVNLAALLYEPVSGRRMEVLTNFPGIQIYTGNHTENTYGKDGYIYDQYAGVCLEAQLYPDAIHHDHFPSPVIRAGETKSYITGYRFSSSCKT